MKLSTSLFLLTASFFTFACGDDLQDPAESMMGSDGTSTGGSSTGGMGSTDAGDITAGAALYAEQGCADCHGASGEGSSAPSLTTAASAWPVEEIEDVIANGAPGMPPFKNLLTEQEITDIAAFVKTL
ncbi:MAG: cytochrome c [Polyangiaceae bacterium]|nr:cytochrome c [Polyangiaceae bacterium]